jgi:alpha-mannosidase
MRERFAKTAIIILLSILMQFTTNAQKRLYIANDDHTDYMWSADSATYQTAFLNMLDWWMDYNDQTAAADPAHPNFHSKFNCDGSFWVKNYKTFRTQAQFDRLITQIRNGKITVPYSPLILTYGSMPAEAVLRSMYYAGQLERDYNLDLDMAYAMENQTLPLGVASLWKGAGAKYSWYGVCNCNTFVTGLGNRQKEIYWYKGLDTNRILMKWYSMVSTPTSTDLGGYAESKLPLSTLANLDAKTTSNPAYPYEIAAGFGYGWDDLETTSDVLVPAAIADHSPNYNVIVSNEVDFFKDFENTYGGSLGSLTQTYGNEWDLACASIAGISGKIKRSLEKLRAAESMAAIVSNYDPTFGGGLDSLKKEAWLALGLYWEHSLNFTSAVPFSERFVFQKRLESVFSSYVDQLYALAQSNLDNLVTNSTGNTRFYVFNPLGWNRDDYADYAYSGSGAIRVMDVSSNSEVPFQLINKGGTQYIRVDAVAIPSVGYKVFEIQPVAGTSFPDAAAYDLSTNTFENSFFKIIYTKQGVLTSILDKVNGNKELVAVTGGKYVNDLGSGLDNNGTASIEFNGPVSTTILLTTTGNTAPLEHTTRITLYKNIPRIDIDNQITENFDATNTWSYSFNISNPEVWHEETGAVIKAKLTSNGGHYATQNARYDWSTLNHFASVNDPINNYGVSLSNEDCYFMKIGTSAPAVLDESSSQLNILAGGKVVGSEGFPDQGDPSETIFNQRFAITTHTTYSAAADMKKALEHQNPMICGTSANPANFLPPDLYSFVYITDPDAVIWALKPAEGNFVDRGVVTRMWNLGNTDLSNSTLHFHYTLPIVQAKRTTHVETDMPDAVIASGSDLLFPLGHNEMRTYRTKMNVIPLITKPVVKLDGNKVQESNILNWTISSQDNIKTYQLERSLNGQQFITITSIAKAGTTLHYDYTDKNINNANPYYYRLKVIDADNKFFYTNTILIKAAKDPSGMMLFPNPVTDVLKVFFMLDKQTRCNVSVISATGAVVKTVAPPLFERGNNYYMLSVKELPAGEYIFCVDTGDKKYVKSFIKN